MFPSRFDYFAPDSLDEALATLGQRADETKVLAGGQSLIPLLKLRFAAPTTLVDIIGSGTSTWSRRTTDTYESAPSLATTSSQRMHSWTSAIRRSPRPLRR